MIDVCRFCFAIFAREHVERFFVCWRYLQFMAVQTAYKLQTSASIRHAFIFRSKDLCFSFFAFEIVVRARILLTAPKFVEIAGYTRDIYFSSNVFCFYLRRQATVFWLQSCKKTRSTLAASAQTRRRARSIVQCGGDFRRAAAAFRCASFAGFLSRLRPLRSPRSSFNLHPSE